MPIFWIKILGKNMVRLWAPKMPVPVLIWLWLIDEKAKFGGVMKPLLWWYILSIPSMYWILHCTFKMGSLLRIFTPSLRIAIFIYPFPVLTRHTVKGRFPMGLPYALDAIDLLMSFSVTEVLNTKGI